MRNKAKLLVKTLLLNTNHNYTTLATLLDTSNQNIGHKINNGSIKLYELIEICELLNKDIIFVDKVK